MPASLVLALPAVAFVGSEELVLRPEPVPLRSDLSYGRYGAGDLYFDGPVDVATDDRDRVFILDRGNHRIQVAGEKGDFAAKWPIASWKGDRDDDPVALALDRKRKALYLLNRKRGWVQRYSLDGTLGVTFGKQGLRSGTLDDPVDVAVDWKGMVYVLDRGRGKVLQYTPEGVFRREFGGKGKRRDEFNDPVSLACIEETIGFVVVLDAGRADLVEFDLDGMFRRREAIPGEVLGEAVPTRLRVDRQDGLFLLAGKERKLIKFERSVFQAFSLGSEGEPLGEAGGLSLDGEDRIYVTDSGRNKVTRFLMEQR